MTGRLRFEPGGFAALLYQMAAGGERFAKLRRVKSDYITNARSLHDGICESGVSWDSITPVMR
jgi:hypothetical protein